VPVGTNKDGVVEYEIREATPVRMPYLAIIIDEVADLMCVARKEIEACVQRLAQKARAAGIHLIAATQRPDTSVLTGVIKANFPTRMSFQAVSIVDSVTMLGSKGAEQLLSCGDMLFSEGGKQPLRVHAALIDTNEIKRIGNFLRKQGRPDYIDDVIESVDDMPNSALGLPPSSDDKDSDLYSQAVEIVRRDNKPRPGADFFTYGGRRGKRADKSGAVGVIRKIHAKPVFTTCRAASGLVLTSPAEPPVKNGASIRTAFPR
jgi:S-DNA-T family DNA segregation ATPase FtsK/SpoIIIE